jgi:hypothetical protein
MKKKPQPYYSKALLLQIEAQKLLQQGYKPKEIAEITNSLLTTVYVRLNVIKVHLETGYLNEDLTLKQ